MILDRLFWDQPLCKTIKVGMVDQLGTTKELLAVGKIVKPQGIKGELKVLPYSGVAEELVCYKEFFLSKNSEPQPFKVLKSRAHGKFFVLQLSAVADRETSEQLVGREILVAKAAMPELSEDEFYWHELKGLRVVTEQGDILGTVTNLMATGANDVLVITGGGKEYLVPATDEILVTVNRGTKTLVIAPLPGLLEINDPDAV